jgi:hypothetical protein
MAESLRGSPSPTSKLGPLLIDVAYLQALEKIIEFAAQASSDLDSKHGTQITFDLAGVQALDRILGEIRANNWPKESGHFRWYQTSLGSVLACAMLQYGNSITAFRSKDNFTNFSVFVEQTQVEYFPFHKVHKCLISGDAGSLESYYGEFTRDV